MNTVVVAAIVAAVVALCGNLIARINTNTQARISLETARLNALLNANVKLSELRIAWINSLREEMTAMVALAVAGEVRNGPTEAYSRAGTKIELLMNPADQDYGHLKTAMARFLGVETGHEPETRNDEFVGVSQRILKREWEVLKKDIKTVVEFDQNKLPKSGQTQTLWTQSLE